MVTTPDTQDTASVGLSFAIEAAYGSLPGENGHGGTAVWYTFEPNEISNDTGLDSETKPRVTINSGGQRDKGRLIRIDGAVGLVADITQNNLRPLMKGHMSSPLVETGFELVTAVDPDTSNPDEYELASNTGFAVGFLIKGFGFTAAANNAVNPVVAITSGTVEVLSGQLVAEASPPAGAYIKVVGAQGGVGDIDVDATTFAYPAYTSTTFDFTTLPIVPGQIIYVGDDNAARRLTTDANNGYKRVYSVGVHTLLIDWSEQPMVTEANTTAQVRIYFGDYIKNVTVPNRTKETLQWETQLGPDDTDAPTQIQSRVLIGADLSVIEESFPIEDDCEATLTFIAADEQYRSGATGLKAGTRTSYVSETAYNTGTDEWGMFLTVLTGNDGSPANLTTAIEECTITVDCHKEPQKKQGTLPSFKSAQGVIEASVDITFYFGTLDVLSAIRANSPVAFRVIMAKENAGFAYDMPYGSLDAAPLDFGDLAIKQQTTFQAARGRQYAAAMDHTILRTWFAYLPTVAMPVSTLD